MENEKSNQNQNAVVSTASKSNSLFARQKLYVESISKGLTSIMGNVSNYQAICGYNILSAINLLLAKEGLDHTSKDVDKESINDAIKFAMVYGLNTDNKEVFVIIRKEKRKGTDDKEYWVSKVECKPQYRGQLKIVSDYGRGVKKVYPEWVVREGDDFTYQMYKGVEIVPPTWTPKGYDGKILRVVVPVLYDDGFIDYRIAERETVATNIKAQIKQSLMKNQNKDVILLKIADMTLDQLLSDKELAPLINDTYTGISKEEMLITKLVINATKRIQIDYSNGYARELIEKTYDNADVYVKNHTAKELLAIQDQTNARLENAEVKQLETKDASALFENDAE